MNRKAARTILRAISYVPGLYVAVAFLVARRVTVRGRSMTPTLLSGERVLFDRLAYVRGRPKRGDIVLVRHPRRSGLLIIKRVTGLAGDDLNEHGVLGPGEYWLAGDNPAESTDSRSFGPVRGTQLLARAWVRYRPAERWEAFG
jgi:signal peptidase I